MGAAGAAETAVAATRASIAAAKVDRMEKCIAKFEVG